MVVTTVPYLERAKDPQGVAIGSVMMKSGISYSIPAPTIRQWLVANRLSPSPFPQAPAQPPLPNAAKLEADRAFATGYLLQTMAIVLHGDADLLKLAIRHYGMAAELRPEAPGIVWNLGLAYASLEQWDKAVQAYSKAMELAPDDPELLADAAVAQQRSGLVNEAAALSQAALTSTRLKSAISVDPVRRVTSDTAR